MKLLTWATSWAIFLAHVLLVGCGTASPVEIKEVDRPVPFYIDTAKIDAPLIPHVMEFAGYCEKFETSELCQKNFKEITSIRLVDSFEEEFVVGKCFVSSAGERWIEIRDGWFDSDSMTMKTLVMHEVGHCALGSPFPHYDDEDDIMNSYLLSEKTIMASWPALIRAMFTRAKENLSLTSQAEVASITSTTIDDSGGFSCENEN